jgi:hypothetical protein
MSQLIRNKLAYFGCALALSGCAAVLKGKTTDVTVTSNTPGAAVTVDGKPAGVTPATIALSNKADAVITVRQADKEESCKMATNASVGWIVADVAFTGGIGVLIDWATHDWNNVQSTTCHVSI